MSGRIRADDAGPGDTPPPVEDPPREPQAPPPEPANDHQPTESGDTPPAGEPPVEDEAEATAKRERDAKTRIDRLNRERYEAIRQRDEYAAMLQQLQRQQPPPGTPPTNAADPYEQGRAQGHNEAQERAVAERFNAACNDLFRRGQDEYGDMPDAVAALNAVGYGARPDALAALTQLPDGHRVYRELASDLDNAARILQLPPMAMALELARMSRGQNDNLPQPANDNGARAAPLPPPVSRAPAPLRPVGGMSARSEKPLSDPNLSMAEFIRRRDREERGSRIRR